MLNNKGFAITTILYGIMILFIMLLLAMLGILNNYKNNLSKIIDGSRSIIKKIDDDTDIVEITGKVCEAKATETEKYTCYREATVTKYKCTKAATASYSGYCTCRDMGTTGNMEFEQVFFSGETTNKCPNFVPPGRFDYCTGTLSDVTYSCSSGKLDGSKCYKYDQSSCSSGWTNTATEWSCTSGSTLKDGKCYKYDQTSCDSGWTETPGTPTYNCLNSTINNKTNMCEVTVNSDEECPQGFTEKINE